MYNMLYGNGDYAKIMIPAISQHYLDKLKGYVERMSVIEEWGEKFGKYYDAVNKEYCNCDAVVITLNGNISPIYKDKITELNSLNALSRGKKDSPFPTVSIHHKHAREFYGGFNLLHHAVVNYNNKLIQDAKLDSKSPEAWIFRDLIVAYHSFKDEW